VRYLLDTNTCIRYLNGRAPAIRVHLAAVPLADVAVCAPVKAELYYVKAELYYMVRHAATTRHIRSLDRRLSCRSLPCHFPSMTVRP
jgi:predicted nucleic acid-binding protein